MPEELPIIEQMIKERGERKGEKLKRECPECYEKWIKAGAMRPLTKEELNGLYRGTKTDI